MRYDHPTNVTPDISVRAVEAGHILGSASLEVTVDENGRRKVIVFSGDLGPRGAPLHRDPIPFKQADVVFLESTYGDRDHPSLAETAIQAREAIKATVEQGGRVLVPVFAIGRSQLLLYLLAGAFKRKTLKPFPIYLDSPMAIRATPIYRSHPELFDEEAIAMRRAGDLVSQLRTARICQKAAESLAIAKAPPPYLVLAGAGMCTGGRILHHLQNHLSNPTTLVLMVGYQSRGSLGRALADGAASVRIAGRVVPVRAEDSRPRRIERARRTIRPAQLGQLARRFATTGHPHARRGRTPSRSSRPDQAAVRPERRDAGLSRHPRTVSGLSTGVGALRSAETGIRTGVHDVESITGSCEVSAGESGRRGSRQRDSRYHDPGPLGDRQRSREASAISS